MENLRHRAEVFFAIGAIAAGVIRCVSPYAKGWIEKTAVPAVKTAFRNVKEKIGPESKVNEIEVVEVSLDVSNANSLTVGNQIETAEKEYRKKMSSKEAQQKFLYIVLLTMELTREVDSLANAGIEDCAA